MTNFAKIVQSTEAMAEAFLNLLSPFCITDKYFSAALLILSRAPAQTGPAEPASPEAPR